MVRNRTEREGSPQHCSSATFMSTNCRPCNLTQMTMHKLLSLSIQTKSVSQAILMSSERINSHVPPSFKCGSSLRIQPPPIPTCLMIAVDIFQCRIIRKPIIANTGLKVNLSDNFSSTEIFFTDYVLYSLRLLKLRTERQTI